MERPRQVEILPNSEGLIAVTKTFQAGIRDDVRRQLLLSSSRELSEVVAVGAGDVTYRIDAHAERHIGSFGRSLSHLAPVSLTAEGIGRKIYGNGAPEIEVIIDPIDGSRNIMYDFRSAWVLTGFALVMPDGATLSDIQVAVMTEIPTSKQDKASVLWAVKGQGAFEEIWDLKTNTHSSARRLLTSQATGLEHGYASFVDFFPGSKEAIGKLSDNVFERVVGPVQEGKALIFNDQYISNAGQIYLLATGRYRFVADLRPEMEKGVLREGKKLGLASHPYDLSTTLIAQEAGAIITDAIGNPLKYPLDTETNCSWVGYANEDIRRQVEPVLLDELSKR